MKKSKNKNKSLSRIEELPEGYNLYIQELKKHIRSTQIKASLNLNQELVNLYWFIGNSIIGKQQNEGWGSKIIDYIAKDLNRSYPGISGFSIRNLKYMCKFAKVYPDSKFVQAVLAQIPWWHNLILLEKVKNEKERAWYAQQTIINGWSGRALDDCIRSKLYQRKGKAITNFSSRLKKPHSELVEDTFKSPYNLDFLTMYPGYHEKDLEKGLIDHIQKMLVELGHGFAFFGRQYPIEVDGVDYYIDLIFYHTKLHCYVVVELKNTDFKPEYAGKIQFYISAIDKKLKSKKDNPTIGLILCKTNKRLTVEYALQDVNKPIGVSEYSVKITESLPKNMKGNLPTIKEIEAELETVNSNAKNS